MPHRLKFAGAGCIYVKQDHVRLWQKGIQGLTALKGPIVRRGGEGLLEELLTEVVQAARRQGVAFGSIQVVGSTHVLADVNVAKDDRRKKREGKPPRAATMFRRQPTASSPTRPR